MTSLFDDMGHFNEQVAKMRTLQREFFSTPKRYTNDWLPIHKNALRLKCVEAEKAVDRALTYNDPQVTEGRERELVDGVRKMREAQNYYFTTKRKTWLIKSKKLERFVDKRLETISNFILGI